MCNLTVENLLSTLQEYVEVCACVRASLRSCVCVCALVYVWIIARCLVKFHCADKLDQRAKHKSTISIHLWIQESTLFILLLMVIEAPVKFASGTNKEISLARTWSFPVFPGGCHYYRLGLRLAQRVVHSRPRVKRTSREENNWTQGKTSDGSKRSRKNDLSSRTMVQ